MSAFWNGRRVCVTGGTGFLGFHLIGQLLEQGAVVRSFGLPTRKPTHPMNHLAGVERIFGDIRDAEQTRRALADCEVIFHTAGLVAMWGQALQTMHAVHVNGTRNVLDGAPRQARIVHTSSIVTVAAGTRHHVYEEDAPFNLGVCGIDYVRAKREAEALALAAGQSGQHVVVTNPGYLLGPEDHDKSGMGRFCVRAWKGRMPMAPPGGYNLVDVRDVATGHLLAAEKGLPGRRYILGGENHSARSFLKLLAEVAGHRPWLIPRVPYAPIWLIALVAEAVGRYRHKEPYPSFQSTRLNHYLWYVNSARAERELGYRVRPLRQSLVETYRWYCDQGRMALPRATRWLMRPTSQAASLSR